MLHLFVAWFWCQLFKSFFFLDLQKCTMPIKIIGKSLVRKKHIKLLMMEMTWFYPNTGNVIKLILKEMNWQISYKLISFVVNLWNCSVSHKAKTFLLNQNMTCASHGVYVAIYLICREQHFGQNTNKIFVRCSLHHVFPHLFNAPIWPWPTDVVVDVLYQCTRPISSVFAWHENLPCLALKYRKFIGCLNLGKSCGC